MHPEFIRMLCDRRAGIGADGVLRVVRASSVRDWDGEPHLWFMDYYNADGSIAEMCGNGLRVFARHLINEQLVDTGSFDVATRAGIKHVEVARHGLIATDIGRAALSDERVTVTLGGQSWAATKVDVGNPHAVVLVDDGVLAGLDLNVAPVWAPASAFPNGVNIEFVHVDGPGALSMRVYERGVGETRSCGTGVVASAAAYRVASDHEGPVKVTVPGGELTVDFDGDNARLTGPAVIVGRGEFWI
jgi:diaminopimelate epimerase